MLSFFVDDTSLFSIVHNMNTFTTNHNQVYFNHNSIKQVPSQKHLGMYLDTKMNT